VSVVIRALNEAQFLSQCLKKIQSQQINLPVEVILVDSGSSDETVSIAKSFGCKVVHIAQADFSFGRALNLGVEQADYTIVVAISAHCIPVGKRWLGRLVAPLLNGTSQMAYGSHLAGRGSRSSEINYFHEKFCHCSGLKTKPLLNNGNSAFLRQLWATRPFNEQLPAQEDMEFALWHMQCSDSQIYFCSQAKVVHHHNDRNKTLFKRLYRELSVEFYLGQKNLQQMLVFFAMVPFFVSKDLATSYKKGVMRRAFKGIFAFRAVQAAAYLQAFRTYQQFVRGRA
jgi:glycosyltransferase involved in cell wall biosynthesis